MSYDSQRYNTQGRYTTCRRVAWDCIKRRARVAEINWFVGQYWLSLSFNFCGQSVSIVIPSPFARTKMLSWLLQAREKVEKKYSFKGRWKMLTLFDNWYPLLSIRRDYSPLNPGQVVLWMKLLFFPYFLTFQIL